MTFKALLWMLQKQAGWSWFVVTKCLKIIFKIGSLQSYLLCVDTIHLHSLSKDFL